MNFCTSQGIQWKHSPPIGPHHDPVWENGVKSCKQHLVGETPSQLHTPDVDAQYK